MTIDETSVHKHLYAASQSEIIAVDTETTGLNVRDGKDYCMGVSLAYNSPALGYLSVYLPFRHDEPGLDRSTFVPILEDCLRSNTLVFHNRKFDLHSLATLGINLEDTTRHYDTLLLAHMINEELPYSKALDSLGKYYIKEGKFDNDRVKKWGELWGWDKIPIDLIDPYACQDAELTLKLYEHLKPMWDERFDDDLWVWEQRFNTVLYRMEQIGVAVDTDFCRQKSEIGYARMDEIEEQLGFKPSSTKELSKFLFDELHMPVLETSEKTGKPSLNKHVMEEYDQMLEATNDKSAKLVLEYRGWQKAVTALYDPMARLVSHDKRVRADFRQDGTRTGRLSCADPNLQQLPRGSDKAWNGNARTAFRSGREGFSLVSYDYSQLELRLATAYGNEQRLLDEFRKPDADPFTAFAGILGVDRFTTKTFFYANIYGAGAAKIAYTLNRSLAEVQDIHDRFKASIPGITQVSNAATKLAKQRGFVKYWTGRRRNFIRSWEEPKYYKAFNSVLQGGAAEIVKRSMVNMSEIESDDCRMVLQIHDEIVFMIKDDKIDEYAPIIEKIMTNHPEFSVPLKVERKVWT